ncbi:hypothetical protein EI94DRAFT_1835100 [Lactarius quietus]|nr:hypothetical protein EI94DRAFT_1835100 [Lactarius quietus]
MSQAPHRGHNLPSAGTGDYQYLPQSVQNEASAHGASTFIDGSGPIFSMYLEWADEEDEKRSENWKADAKGILIFTGLFSAAVAALITVSIQDLRQDPQVTSNFYLANIYEALADPNRANISTPSSPPPFSPPNYAIWVNAFWILSLVISITCALLATLLQQWARRYLKATQPHCSLHKRARIRSFFSEGVDNSVLPLVVEALPTLLHISLLLFFAGLVVFLWNIDLTIFKLVLSWVSMCSALYVCTTIIPLFHHDSPFYTPLTPLTRLIAIVILKAFIFLRTYLNRLAPYCAFYCVCELSVWRRILGHKDRGWLVRVLKLISLTPEEAALESPEKIITRAFMWTLDSLDEDHELDRFFSSLPSFRSSKAVKDPLPRLTKVEKGRLFETLLKFLDITFSSDVLPKPVKIQRAIMCAKACDVTKFSHRSADRLYDKVVQFCCSGPQATNFGPIANDSRTEHTAFVQSIVTSLVARRQQRDDTWFRQVAPNALGIPETILRDHAANGDSLLLAILIYATRQHFTYLRYSHWPYFDFRDVLEANSKLNAQDTLPKLQHEFCALWNQIVHKAQNEKDRRIAELILRPIRHIYITLHHGTNSAPRHFSATTPNWDVILEVPSSYPVCQVADHCHDNSASAPLTVLRNAIAPAPASLSSSSYITAPLYVVESPTDPPSLDNFQTAQTSIDLCIPADSADLATGSGIRDIDTSSPIPHLTPESSTSTPRSCTPLPTSASSSTTQTSLRLPNHNTSHL